MAKPGMPCMPCIITTWNDIPGIPGVHDIPGIHDIPVIFGLFLPHSVRLPFSFSLRPSQHPNDNVQCKNLQS